MSLIINQIAQELSLKVSQVEATIKLIDEGNTIPFIARYRKEMTGGISDEVLREFDDRLKYLRNLEERKGEVIRIIEEQGKLTPDLKADIQAATVLQKVEDLYRPYKQKKSTRATKAKDKGLEPLATIIFDQEEETPIEELAAAYINEELGVKNMKDALAGAMDIIAEQLSDSPEYREYIRNYVISTGTVTSVATNPEEKTVYEMYYEYAEGIKTIPNHRILAINRGEKEKALKVKVNVDDVAIKTYLGKEVIKASTQFTEILETTIADSFKRLIMPSVEREVRSSLTERAEEEAIKVFAKNTKPLLMVPPVKDVRVLAIDPSYRTGCKLAVLDDTGKLLEYTTIYPNEPQNQVEKSKKVLKQLIEKYHINIIPIGNGTASRETEQLVAELLGEMKQEVYYTIVSEAGASVYSASKLATEEYPDVDVSIRGAISIGRRLQDPLAELVKIDPKSIGVGQYQHDLNQKRLGQSLGNVVEDCVNNVGVDLNTASPSLLNYVAGISSATAKNIVAYREENGKFMSRSELLKVKRLGDKVFEQCAGFLRIAESENPLDNSGVHPESYEVAGQLLSALGFTMENVAAHELAGIEGRIAELVPEKAQPMNIRGKGFEALKQLQMNNKKNDKKAHAKRYEKGLQKLAQELGAGVPTLKDIVSELKKPGRDPREDMPKPIFRSDVLKMEDLQVGMVLSGTVRNVIDFGAFVDIGVKQDGLVHISQMSDQFVKNPMSIVSVGDLVEVKIIDIDLNRGKVSLSMKGLNKK
jgi:uncharacterized protein